MQDGRPRDTLLQSFPQVQTPSRMDEWSGPFFWKKPRVDKQIETAIGQMTQIIFGAQWVASSPCILELCLGYVREEVWEWVDKQVELSLWLITILNINFHRSLISQTLKWLKDINYTPHGKNIMVGTVHRPPYRNFSMFLKKFNDIFSKISKDNKQF